MVVNQTLSKDNGKESLPLISLSVWCAQP